MSYRGYITVHGDDGKRLGPKGLQPVVANLNAHARAYAEEKDPRWPLRHDPFRVATHLGKPVIRLEVGSAWEVRLAYRAARMFLTNTGWGFVVSLNANTRRAL